MDFKLSTQPYKGTRDFYPREMRLRNWFFGKIRDALELACFEEYEGPMLESLDLYAAKSGEELAKEQTYNFEDRGGRSLAIRPEMTPTVARMVAAKMGELNYPLKWFSIANMYRYERPQRGRLREFWQLNVDIFGCDTFEADLDVIKSAITVLRAFGADESMFLVHINNRRFFNDAIAAIAGTDTEGARRVSKVVDRKNKVPRETYEADLKALGLTDEQIAKIDALYTMNVTEATALCPDSVGATELRALFDALEKTGLAKYCTFDFGIIRGLDYYTGTVFEVFDNAPENNRAMFGGGRYDNLVGLFQKNASISGVGYGMGDVTLENFLTTHNLIPDFNVGKTKVLITRFADVPLEAYNQIADTLFSSGVRACLYLGNKKFGKQIDFAAKEHYSHVIIMGSDELASGTVKVKNLGTREENVVKIEALDSFFTDGAVPSDITWDDIMNGVKE
ncbi:MAG: histidine--tRNA ligase [Clostridia bacterium]|nr:histidine--tRNA ligase [Clostridia bacterium]